MPLIKIVSLNKNQFEVLIFSVIQKIKETEGVMEYIRETPCCFDNTLPDKHLHYQATTTFLIDLDKLSDDGAMIPSNDYHSFIDQLIVDTQDLIKAVKLQRQPFVEYLEKIKNL